MYVSLALVSGGLVALMILVNGNLQAAVGPLPALIFIHGSGLVTSAIYVLVALRGASGRGRRPGSGEAPAALPAVSAAIPAAIGPDSGAADRVERPGKGALSGATAAGAASPRSERPAAPLWFAGAGILGIGVVFLNNLIFAKGGVLLALGGTLAGQTLLAHLLEGTRWFDRRRSPLLQRVLSLGLVLPGAAIIGLRSGVGVGWVALSWLPGAILMVQSMMNARNALRWGQPRMVLFNYSSALLVLIPLFAFAGGALSAAGGIFSAPGSSFAPGALTAPGAAGRLVPSGGGWSVVLHAVETLPSHRIVGGGIIGVIVVGTTAFLFNRASALKVVLALYTGQILIGILLDSLSGLPLQPDKVAGVLMVLVGLGAGEVHHLRRRAAADRSSTRDGGSTPE